MTRYDFVSLRGPDAGAYDFTVGLASTPGLDPTARMTREQLMDKARGFIDGFCEPGDIGSEDFSRQRPRPLPWPWVGFPVPLEMSMLVF